jgi:hypothetical protein
MNAKRGRGVLLFDKVEPKISGYLIIGNEHYQIVGERMSDIRTHLDLRQTGEATSMQGDLFDEDTVATGN